MLPRCVAVRARPMLKTLGCCAALPLPVARLADDVPPRWATVLTNPELRASRALLPPLINWLMVATIPAPDDRRAIEFPLIPIGLDRVPRAIAPWAETEPAIVLGCWTVAILVADRAVAVPVA